jgi:2-phospho-L-lactate guanylyltransferase
LIWAIVPVKDFHAAKQRLRGVLAPEERRALARAMLEDVLAALGSVREVDRLLLVTREPHAFALARRFGASILWEPSRCGQTAAVERALAEARRQGARAVLAVPADVPLIAPADVEAILRASAQADVVLVPSRDGRGTNAIWLASSVHFPLRFGEESFPFHHRAAQERALRTIVLRLPRLALDVDVPEDLRALARRYADAPELARRSPTAALFEERQWLARFR